MKNTFLIAIILTFSVTFSSQALQIDPEQPLLVTLESSEDNLGLDFLIQATDDRSVIVRIRNRDRDIVFQKAFYGSKVYKGTFNLEDLSNGQYYLEVRHSNQKYVKQINLKKYSLRTVSIK